MRIGIDSHFESKIQQGTDTYISELIAAIARIDKQNYYFLLNAEYSGQVYHFDAQNIIKKAINTNSTKKNIIYGYRRAAIENNLDILHTNYLAPFWITCKRVVTIHDILYLSHRLYFPFVHRFQLRILTPITLFKADKIISVSEYTRNEIIRRYRVKPEKICVIHEAASPEFKMIKEKDSHRNLQNVRWKYGLYKDFVLYVGRLVPIKNIPRMISVIMEYNNNAKEKILLVIVGNKDPVYPDKHLQSLLKYFKKSENIIVLENVLKSELISLYNMAKAFLFLTYGEGFGLPVLEAMACGVPVITSNVTSCSEVAGDAAILVDPNNNREIIEALTSLLDNENQKKKYIEKGLKRARYFSWDKCAKETIKVYQGLKKNN